MSLNDLNKFSTVSDLNKLSGSVPDIFFLVISLGERNLLVSTF